MPTDENPKNSHQENDETDSRASSPRTRTGNRETEKGRSNSSERQWNWLRHSLRWIGLASIRVVKKRFAIGMIFLLTLWTLVGCIPALASIVHNALLLDTMVQLAFFSSLNLMATVFCIAILRVLNGRVGSVVLKRLVGDGGKPWELKTYTVALLAFAVSPLVLSVFYGTEYSGVFYTAAPGTDGIFTHDVLFGFVAFLSITLGGICGWGMLYGAGKLKLFLFGGNRNLKNFLPFENTQATGRVQSLSLWTNLKEKTQSIRDAVGLEDIDFQLTGYLFLLLVVHFCATFTLADSPIWLASAPALVVILIWIVGLFISGMAYLLDKLMIPTLPVLFLLIAIVYALKGGSAEFNTVADKSSSKFIEKVHAIRQAEVDAMASEIDPTADVLNVSREIDDLAWEAIKRRMKAVSNDLKHGKTLVIVTCPGGGIHAAAWSTYVLQSISKQYPEFAKSVCVLSCVSGGSIGGLYYLSHQYNEALGGGEFEYTPFELATESTLEPIAYGIMADEFYGTILPFAVNGNRGQRLEDSVINRLPEKHRNFTLGQWGDVAKEGKMPIVVFNATDAVSGRRVLFDTVPTPIRASGIGLASRPFNYRELLDPSSNVDVMPSTAARISATFPYVSPWVQPKHASKLGLATAMGDGGYVDNEGIVSAIDWLSFFRTRMDDGDDDKPFQRILLLRIAPSTYSAGSDDKNANLLFDSMRWLTGPIETIVNVRSASQSERGNLESDLAVYTDKDFDALKTSLQLNEAPTLAAQFLKVGSTMEISKARRISSAGKMAASKKINSDFKQSDIENMQMQTKEPEERDLSQFYNAPVIRIEVPFVIGEDKVIPLNWKLKREQKTWYKTAWELNENPENELPQLLQDLFSTN